MIRGKSPFSMSFERNFYHVSRTEENVRHETFAITGEEGGEVGKECGSEEEACLAGGDLQEFLGGGKDGHLLKVDLEKRGETPP